LTSGGGIWGTPPHACSVKKGVRLKEEKKKCVEGEYGHYRGVLPAQKEKKVRGKGRSERGQKIQDAEYELHGECKRTSDP